jgi:2-polyprenyl-6-methoxyphenol hydroxylase-like FAD-dependent oxidoreductase
LEGLIEIRQDGQSANLTQDYEVVSMANGSPTARQAIVIGAGMGGLTSAAALAPHFARVVVVERDDLPASPLPRAGVPQGKHVHGLLGGGLDALARLFPGFEDALAAAGAVPIRVGLDSRLEQLGYDPFPQRDLGRWGYSMSRPLLEQVVRQFVARDRRIEIRTGSPVREIVASADRAGVSAVRISKHGSTAETLQADLVVDATGRAALTMEFLQGNGYRLPEESSIAVDIRYTCGVFRLPVDDTRNWKVLMTRPDPKVSGRRAIMFPIEGSQQWILGLGGVNGDSAPTDLEGFLEYARTLRTSTAFNAIRSAELNGELTRFAFPKSFRRHFERMVKFPRGLLPVADSICRINPSFGQGMSVAAKEAVLLSEVLDGLSHLPDPLIDLVPAFLDRLDTVLGDPWSVAAQDYAYEHLANERPPEFAETLKFQAALTRLAAADPAIHRLMTEVAQLLKPSSVLREPAITERLGQAIHADSPR